MRGTRGFALCSVLACLSPASAEAVTRRLRRSLCRGERLGNRSVGAETLSSGEKPVANTWGSEHVGRDRVGEGGFIVAPVVGGGWRASEAALRKGKRIWQSSGMEKVAYAGKVRYIKAPALVGMNKGDEGDSLDRRKLRR